MCGGGGGGEGGEGNPKLPVGEVGGGICGRLLGHILLTCQLTCLH